MSTTSPLRRDGSLVERLLCGPWRHLRRDDAVAEVISTVLIVAMTVLMTAGLVGLLLATKPGPVDEVHAEFSVEVEDGTSGWGTGDEHVSVRHVGGERLTHTATVIFVTVDDVSTRYDPGGTDPLDHAQEAAFDTAGADDTFTIGDTWRTPDETIEAGDRIQVNVVTTGEASRVIWSATANAGSLNCATDLTAPRVNAWLQAPSDVTTQTTGDVHVRATIRDACNTVDATSPPHLEFRLNDGSDPAYTDEGTMSQGAGARWHGNITGVTWSDHSSETLQYKVTGMADSEGNTGDSGVQSDPVELVGTQTPVTLFTVVEGSPNDPSEADAASDDGTEVTLTEASQSRLGSLVFDANGFEDPSSTWSTESNAFADDDQYATTTDTNPVEFHTEDPETLTSVDIVTLRANVSIDATGNPNDAFTLAACFPDGSCGEASPEMGSASSDTAISWTVTGSSDRHPLGNSSWTVSDVEALQIQITPVAQGAADGTWRVDHTKADVTGDVSFESLHVQGDLDGVPNGAIHQLELEYHVDGDTFHVEVYDWNASAWTTRGARLDESAATPWTYELTDDEYDPGAERVRIRFIDDTDGSTQGSLSLDYLWVVSS